MTLGIPFLVRTLEADDLRKAAEELAELAHGFAPDLMVGILSGGYVVAELMVEHVPRAVLLPITCRRPSTAKKKKVSLLKSLLRKLPRPVNNCLRVLEHIVLTQLRRPSPITFTPSASELEAIRRVGATKILIVDDSVDSGATLDAIYKAISGIMGNAIIKTAAITVTTRKPLMEPDFFLYRYVLCRFPWSLDAKR